MESVKDRRECLQARAVKSHAAANTSLMEPAKALLLKALYEVEDKMKPPTCNVYMNLTGTRITPNTMPSEIIPMLAEQICSCVLWEPLVKAMINDGVHEFYECGPMKQLKAMMKRIDASTFKTTTNV